MNLRENSSKAWVSQIKFASYRIFSRRRFLIKRRLQYSLLVLALSYVVFFAVSVAALMFIPTILQLRALDPASAKASQLATELLYLHSNFWPAILSPLVVIGLHSILTSHRIAGPLYRFGIVFNSVEQGLLPKPIRLRNGDYLTTEMDQINRMVHSLRDRIESIRAAQEELCEALDAYRRNIGGELPETARQALKDIELKNAELKRKLDGFTIEI